MSLRSTAFLAFPIIATLFGCSLSPVAQPMVRSLAEPPAYDAADLEQRVLQAVNRLRQTEGRVPVRGDSALAAIARAHSRDMRDRGFVAHRNPDGRSPGERAHRSAYTFREFGENIFRGRLYDIITQTRNGDEERVFHRWYTPDAFANFVADMWMESPGHRENMLAERYDYGGVGIVVEEDYYVFVTLNLSAQ